MNEATPRPWYRGKGADASYILSVGDGQLPNKRVAELYYGCTSREERNANGDLIVCAVNSHDALVEALRRARELLARGRGAGVSREYREHLALAAENTLIETLDALEGNLAKAKE